MTAYVDTSTYKDLRNVGGVLCGTLDFLTTRGLIVGINPATLMYERRYCYQHRADAVVALALYENTDEHPAGPWIKVKGLFRGEYIDAMNPDWPDRKPWDELAPR